MPLRARKVAHPLGRIWKPIFSATVRVQTPPFPVAEKHPAFSLCVPPMFKGEKKPGSENGPIECYIYIIRQSIAEHRQRLSSDFNKTIPGIFPITGWPNEAFCPERAVLPPSKCHRYTLRPPVDRLPTYRSYSSVAWCISPMQPLVCREQASIDTVAYLGTYPEKHKFIFFHEFVSTYRSKKNVWLTI